MPTNATYEEIDCDVNYKKVTENKIITVPTIILLNENTKKQYLGNKNYDDIKLFLANNGVHLIEQRTFEGFNMVDDMNMILNENDNRNPNCPAVTFDKQIDIENDKYLYQIFNSDGQYGYAEGGYNKDKILTPFLAAYSTVDSYLSSLPDNANPNGENASYQNIDECAGLYSENIVNFGLCDSEELNKILNYSKNCFAR